MERGYLQHRAELSRLDDSVVRERRFLEQEAVQAAAAERTANAAALARGEARGPSGYVPGQDGYVYDPSHHAADYAGLVSKDSLERTHFSGSSLEHVSYGELGVVPAKGVPTLDRDGVHGCRKHFAQDARFASREVVPGSAPLFADPSYYVAGGQADRFTSTAMDAARSRPTDPSLLVDHGKEVGRKHVAPAFERAAAAKQHLADLTNESGIRTGHGGRVVAQGFNGPSGYGPSGAYSAEEAVQRGQLVGYRATAFKAGAPSLLSGIGTAVNRAGGLQGFPDRPARKPEGGVAPGAREKGTHMLDAPPGYTPGYTGRRVR